MKSYNGTNIIQPARRCTRSKRCPEQLTKKDLMPDDLGWENRQQAILSIKCEFGASPRIPHFDRFYSEWWAEIGYLPLLLPPLLPFQMVPNCPGSSCQSATKIGFHEVDKYPTNWSLKYRIWLPKKVQ
jgi:hypothetical protein